MTIQRNPPPSRTTHEPPALATAPRETTGPERTRPGDRGAHPRAHDPVGPCEGSRSRRASRCRGKAILVTCLLGPCLVSAFAGEEPAALRARYRVLPAETGQSAPVDRVTITTSGVSAGHVDWELEVTVPGSSTPQCVVSAGSTRSPLAGALDARDFLHYRLYIPAAGDRLEYRDRLTRRALLPEWDHFTRFFLPTPAPGAQRRDGVPVTCRYLGHVLSLESLDHVDAPRAWTEMQVLELESDLLIGTGRTFKDSEEARIPQTPERRNYTYVPWSREDYETLIAAGFNSFALVPGIEKWLRARPVFYRRGLAGDAPLVWPADFYRSNYRGSVMYEDEPACVMWRDEVLRSSIRHFSDFAEVLRGRIVSRYERKARGIEKALRDAGTSLGTMALAQPYPVWETRFETAWYQLQAGFSGFVHEGRYDLDDFYQSGESFDAWVEASTGIRRSHGAEEMLRYLFAFLRGAARHHRKDWGTSIYGQADPVTARRAVTLAHDMGARWVWFWTSDHGHHLPWPEQLALARIVRAHARAHPRPPRDGQRPVLDRVIVLPAGAFLFVESPTHRRNPWDLWWMRGLDAAGKNEASLRYRELRRRAFVEIHRALDDGADFDIAVDDGREIEGYRKLIRIEAP